MCDFRYNIIISNFRDHIQMIILSSLSILCLICPVLSISMAAAHPQFKLVWDRLEDIPTLGQISRVGQECRKGNKNLFNSIQSGFGKAFGH